MNTFVGHVTFHNGRFERSLNVKVKAGSYHVAVTRATLQAEDQLKRFLSQFKKRIHVEAIHITLRRVKSGGKEREINEIPTEASPVQAG